MPRRQVLSDRAAEAVAHIGHQRPLAADQRVDLGAQRRRLGVPRADDGDGRARENRRVAAQSDSINEGIRDGKNFKDRIPDPPPTVEPDKWVKAIAQPPASANGKPMNSGKPPEMESEGPDELGALREMAGAMDKEAAV